jgi:DNA-binding NarL/FixJ family response regulator
MLSGLALINFWLGVALLKSSTRILLVEDFEPWRRFYRSALEKLAEFQVVGEASDGLEAVDQARQLQPDLILLDIGLPALNGIDAARRIREISPASKILFVSENRSADIVGEALSIGANGYVLKSDAAGELLRAVNAVLEGKRYVSGSLARSDDNGPLNQHSSDHPYSDNVVRFAHTQKTEITRQHEVGFFSGDRQFLDHVTRFVAGALKAGNAAIVVATESHRESLRSQLEAEGLDMGALIERGRYIPLDAADTLSAFMVNGMPDPVRFLELLGDLIVTATEAASGENPRVSVFGECVHLLWAQGNTEAAIQMEKLGNKLVKIHDVQILCGYSLGSVASGIDSHTFERICAEHSAVHSL